MLKYCAVKSRLWEYKTLPDITDMCRLNRSFPRKNKMKRNQTTLILLCLFLSNIAVADNRMTGKTFLLKWSIQSVTDEVSIDATKVIFCDAEKLLWNTELNGETISSGFENYALSEIEPGIVQVTWRQQLNDRTEVVVSTLNLFKWSVYGVTISSDEPRFSAGSFQIETDTDPGKISKECT